MENSGDSPNVVFNVGKVRKLVELMNEHELAEIDLKQGDQRIRLRKGLEAASLSALPAAAAAAPPAAAAASPPPSPAGPPAADAAADTERVLTIDSPMVGTFYPASSPDAAPFVNVGDRVGPQTTVCIVEAMKVFNEIPAECSGKIVAVLAENGAPVEFGQPLFKVDPS